MPFYWLHKIKIDFDNIIKNLLLYQYQNDKIIKYFAKYFINLKIPFPCFLFVGEHKYLHLVYTIYIIKSRKDAPEYLLNDLKFI